MRVGAQQDLIAILQKSSLLSRRKHDRLLATHGGFQHAAEAPRPGPEIVPVPSKSPARRSHPLDAWWVTICAAVQYMCLALLTAI
jgi:hypothetical protein